jgi:hypothetical protein
VEAVVAFSTSCSTVEEGADKVQDVERTSSMCWKFLCPIFILVGVILRLTFKS